MSRRTTTLVKTQTSHNPRLRFIGFGEPWKLKPMKQLLHLTERPFKMVGEEVYSLITVRRGNNGVVSRGRYEGRKVLVKAQFKVEAGDFVISKRQIVHQACGIVPAELDGAIVSNEYNVFKPSSECCIRYFDYFCYRPEMRHAFFLSCVGVHLEKMLFRTNDWLKRRFYFPSAAEQRKIAEFLTAVDVRIQQLSQKKALLEDYKRGVMKQIFTQALRFKDDHGNEFPDWEEKTLGEVVTSLDAGVSVNSEDAPASEAEMGILKTSCVTKGMFDPTENKRVTADEELVRLKEPVSAGSIIISRMNTPALVGLSGLVPQSYPNLFLPDRLWAAKIGKGHSPEWTAQLLRTPTMRALISAKATGTSGSMKNITKGDVLSLPVNLPSPAEQTKIANFLSALDRKIESVAQQITHTQAFKQGLLQQMFV